MAKGKKSFTAYCDWKSTFDALPDELAGKLVKHLFAYVNDESPETEDVIINAVFANIKNQLKRDLVKWEEKREKNRANARKRWDKKNATVCDGIQSDAKGMRIDANYAVTDTVTVTDTVKENNNINTPTKVEIDFKQLLKLINTRTKRNFRTISDKVKKSYKARLKEGYTKDDIRNAIDNAVKTQYHIENNFQYLTPEFFSRSVKLDMYCDTSNVKTISEEQLKRQKAIELSKTWQTNPYND